MDEKLLEEFKQALLQAKKEILQTINERHNAENSLREPKDIPTDFGDKATEESDRGLFFDLTQRDTATLQQIEEALEKIKEGTYGICENCGEEINHLRLRAMPFAKYCVKCQEEQEKNKPPRHRYEPL